MRHLAATMSANSIMGSLLNSYAPSLMLVAIAVLLMVWQRLSVKMDPREPPLVKPKIPYIGHILGLMKNNTAYFDRMSGRTICTLPMINSKIYVITDPSLVQSAFRSKALSFEPFMAEFAQRMLDLEEEVMIPIRNMPEDDKEQSLAKDFTHEIHSALSGASLHQMNANALNSVAESINNIEESFQPDSLWLWLRTTLSLATSTALLGSHNPMIKDRSLENALWDFEANLIGLLIAIFPSITAAKAHKARIDWKIVLRKYYNAGYDHEPDVAQVTKSRAKVYRKWGLSNTSVGDIELSLVHVSTANAIPTLFWHLVQIAADATLTEDIRKELLAITSPGSKRSDGKREILLDITKLEDHCPVLASSYREAIRLANAQLGTRRVLRDTTISDGKNSYLLKKGADVFMPTSITHLATSIWGPNASEFDARRFMKLDPEGLTDKEKEKDKLKKKAFFPFGGGKHLCPGRNFAFAEILGTIAVLLLGFDVKNTDGGLIQVPKLDRANFGQAVGKPDSAGAKMGAKIERRKGWEDVVWKFVC